jgi:hypothetical protein
VNGNATEAARSNLAVFDNSSSVGEIYTNRAETISEPASEQSMPAVSELITMSILGAGLVILGVFARNKLSQR